MKIRPWILILIGAFLLALFTRIFIFETIRVATPAMSESQKTGNRLLVGKLALGPRMPGSIGIPFVPDTLFGRQTYTSLNTFPKRIPGFGKIKRNDLIAFNIPSEKKIAIDHSPILLSRCVGLPGEHFRLSGGKMYINHIETQHHPDVSFCFSIPPRFIRPLSKLLQSSQIRCEIYQKADSGYIYLTRPEQFKLRKLAAKQILQLKPCFSTFDEKDVFIPNKGFQIILDDSTFNLWGGLINRFEGITLKRSADGLFFENNTKIERYTFKQNYYFLLNDHQGYLDDSRTFGILPESHIIGRATMILLSPRDKRFLQKIE
jgi:signal peptidase I